LLRVSTSGIALFELVHTALEPTQFFAPSAVNRTNLLFTAGDCEGIGLINGDPEQL